ncbi:MAG: YjiH family protein, partial [Epulopiscium sp.]|nr:YjiH family protein [Candidatus Epulonipiscium sp.]
LPGRASIDLIASWLGASNAAVILTKRQYDAGFYSAREAAVIMTNFSVVSIPFCLIIANILGIGNLFPIFYLVICIVGFVLALIMPRIAPLRNIPDDFSPKTGKRVKEMVPEEYSIFGWAIEQSCDRAEKFKVQDLIKSGNSVLFSMLFSLIPVVITWGTISLILVEYTPIFQWLSYPMGYYLKILGVEYAFEAAPATLVGFVDMFIPALLITGIESVKTKFIIGILSLIQIIYVTEVGVIIIQSDVPLQLKDLFIIFLQRTIISLPIIVLLANILIK